MLRQFGGKLAGWARWSSSSDSSPWPPIIGTVARFFLELAGQGSAPTAVASYLHAFKAFHL
eukprot:9435819-Heterocapsa_arctica.AAC.1